MKHPTYTKHKGRNTRRGFTLFFAVLTASLLLALGLAIATITIKEIQLSSSVRESQFALFAADSGIECALYWDLRGTDVFATSTESSEPSSGVVCNGEDIAQSWTVTKGPTSAQTTFTLTFLPENRCSTVVVAKSGGVTSIDARGYNTCDINSPRRVERGVRARY